MTVDNQPPCYIRVIVYEPGENGAVFGEVIHDKQGNHNDRFFRDWINRTEWWAMRNGKISLKRPI